MLSPVLVEEIKTFILSVQIRYSYTHSGMVVVAVQVPDAANWFVFLVAFKC